MQEAPINDEGLAMLLPDDATQEQLDVVAALGATPEPPVVRTEPVVTTDGMSVVVPEDATEEYVDAMLEKLDHTDTAPTASPTKAKEAKNKAASPAEKAS